jgi:hypothetical protein
MTRVQRVIPAKAGIHPARERPDSPESPTCKP